MFYIKLLKENSEYIWIGYSIEASNACDGVILYNKKNESIELLKQSESDETGMGASMVYEHIYRALREKTLTEKVHKIVCW